MRRFLTIAVAVAAGLRQFLLSDFAFQDFSTQTPVEFSVELSGYHRVVRRSVGFGFPYRPIVSYDLWYHYPGTGDWVSPELGVYYCEDSEHYFVESRRTWNIRLFLYDVGICLLLIFALLYSLSKFWPSDRSEQTALPGASG